MNALRRGSLTALLATILLLPSSLLAQDGATDPAARDAFKQAMALNRSKQYAKALEYFLKAHQTDPSILSEDDQGLLANATQYLQEQLAANPNDINHCFQLAELHALRGQFDEALTYYRKVGDLNRNTPLANLADAEIKRIEAMQQAAATAAAAVPTAPPAPTTPPPPSADVTQLEETVQALEQRIAQLEAENKTAREEAQEAREDKEKLQKEFDELKSKAETWKLYYRLYMANPANVQNLRDRRSW